MHLEHGAVRGCGIGPGVPQGRGGTGGSVGDGSRAHPLSPTRAGESTVERRSVLRCDVRVGVVDCMILGSFEMFVFRIGRAFVYI